VQDEVSRAVAGGLGEVLGVPRTRTRGEEAGVRAKKNDPGADREANNEPASLVAIGEGWPLGPRSQDACARRHLEACLSGPAPGGRSALGQCNCRPMGARYLLKKWWYKKSPSGHAERGTAPGSGMRVRWRRGSRFPEKGSRVGLENLGHLTSLPHPWVLIGPGSHVDGALGPGGGLLTNRMGCPGGVPIPGACPSAGRTSEGRSRRQRRAGHGPGQGPGGPGNP